MGHLNINPIQAIGNINPIQAIGNINSIQAIGNIDANSITTRSINNETGYTKLWDMTAEKFSGRLCNKDNKSPYIRIDVDSRVILEHQYGKFIRYL